MMWLSAEMYHVWGGCRTRDVKNIWPNSICFNPQWPYLLGSFGHLRVGCVWRLGPALHPPKHCANTLNCTSHLLLNGWVHAGLASRTLLEKAWHILSPKTTHDSCPLIVAVWVDWLAPPTPKYHPNHDGAGAQRLQGSNDRCVKFCWLSICASATGFAAERDRFATWQGDIDFLCLCRLTA